MIASQVSTDEFHLRLSRDELSMISNCMNETLNGLYIEEFSTRVGAEEEYVKRIHDQILKLLRSE